MERDGQQVGFTERSLMGLLVETKHGCQTIHENILMRLPTKLLTLKQELSKKQTIRKALSKREFEIGSDDRDETFPRMSNYLQSQTIHNLNTVIISNFIVSSFY